MRVMLDTNVLISALVFNSKVLNSVIDLASRGDDHLLLSAYVIDEAREVVRRKWPNRISAFDRFIARLNFELIEAAEIVDGLFLIRDPMDYPVLYYALIGDADVCHGR